MYPSLSRPDDNDVLGKIASDLFENGIVTTAVPKPIAETGRLRFVCSVDHAENDVDRVIDTLTKSIKKRSKDLKHLSKL